MARHQPSREIAAAIQAVEADGYVVLRTGSYRQMQERHRVAEAQLRWETENLEGTRRWAEQAFHEQRRLADRLNQVVLLAVANGVAVEDLWALQSTLREAAR